MCILHAKYAYETTNTTYEAWRYWGLTKGLILEAAHRRGPSQVWRGRNKRTTDAPSQQDGGDQGLHSITKRPSRDQVYGRVSVQGKVSVFCKYGACKACGRDGVQPKHPVGYLSSQQTIISLVVPKRFKRCIKRGNYSDDPRERTKDVYVGAAVIARALRKRYKVPVVIR